MKIANQSGDVESERELHILYGGFQCVDVPYAELVAAGLEPDRTTGALTFRVDILSPVGSKRIKLSAAVMMLMLSPERLSCIGSPHPSPRLTGRPHPNPTKTRNWTDEIMDEKMPLK